MRAAHSPPFAAVDKQTGFQSLYKVRTVALDEPAPAAAWEAVYCTQSGLQSVSWAPSRMAFRASRAAHAGQSLHYVQVSTTHVSPPAVGRWLVTAVLFGVAAFMQAAGINAGCLGSRPASPPTAGTAVSPIHSTTTKPSQLHTPAQHFCSLAWAFACAVLLHICIFDIRRRSPLAICLWRVRGGSTCHACQVAQVSTIFFRTEPAAAVSVTTTASVSPSPQLLLLSCSFQSSSFRLPRHAACSRALLGARGFPAAVQSLSSCSFHERHRQAEVVSHGKPSLFSC